MHSQAQEPTISSANSTSRAKMQKLLSQLLTSSDVAKILGTSPSVMRGLMNARELTPLGKVGPVMLFLRSDVEELRLRRDQWRLGKRQR